MRSSGMLWLLMAGSGQVTLVGEGSGEVGTMGCAAPKKVNFFRLIH